MCSKLEMCGSSTDKLALPGTCPHCRKLIITCSCLRMGLPVVYRGLHPRIRRRPATVDDVLLDGILDIEDAEAQPGYYYDDVDSNDPFCEKADQHGEFIHADMFALHHLPEKIQHQSFLEWLQNCVPSVVRLIADSGVATGRACLIYEEYNKTVKCSSSLCRYARTLGPDHQVYGGLGIITNCHVVQNDSQASRTEIEFFFDNTDRASVVIEVGATVHFTNKKMDYTVFSCYVHNRELITRMEQHDLLRNQLWQTIPQHIRDHSRKFAIVISHPHGASKKISIGDVVDRKTIHENDTESENARLFRDIYEICDSTDVYRRDRNDALRRFVEYYRQVPGVKLPYTVTWYSTATCRGSSGAPVYMGNTVTENGLEINQAHTHRGKNESKGLNNCFT